MCTLSTRICFVAKIAIFVCIKGIPREAQCPWSQSPGSVVSTFVNTVYLLPKYLKFEHGAPNLFLSGRYLTSVRPWCASKLSETPEPIAVTRGPPPRFSHSLVIAYLEIQTVSTRCQASFSHRTDLRIPGQVRGWTGAR